MTAPPAPPLPEPGAPLARRLTRGRGHPPAAKTPAAAATAPPPLAAEATAGAPPAAPASAGWREVPPPTVVLALGLPVGWYERATDEAGAEAAGPPTARHRQRRFLVDLGAMAGGRVQIDGFVNEGRQTISLVVRSERPLDAPTQQAIASLLTEGAALAGWQGDLAFFAGGTGLIAVSAAAARTCRLSV